MAAADYPVKDGNGNTIIPAGRGEGPTSGLTVGGSAVSSSNPIPTEGPVSAATAVNMVRHSNTTQYTLGDLIANDTTAGNVVPIVLPVARAIDKPVVLRRLRLKVNDSAWKSHSVRVHLFKDTPVVSVGDNAALNVSETYGWTESNYLGYGDIVFSQQSSDGYVKGFVNVDIIAEPKAGTVNIHALLEARSNPTPGASKTFTLTPEELRD